MTKTGSAALVWRSVGFLRPRRSGAARNAITRVGRAVSTVRPGVVYLVGAGPGDPELITVRGLQILRAADVVVYDRLVHPALIREAPRAAERIYAGKRPGRHALVQAGINAVLIDRARAGAIVARLKGGDPFVFGRGGEECEALRAAEVPFEVVPGVTSAVAAPAYAGIPVTHRRYASAFAVVTGHACRAPSPLDWAALARMPALVVVMGLRTLPETTRRLIAHGAGAGTPAAVVCAGTTPRQVTVVGTLATIAERAREAPARPPAVLVVGEVVRLRRALGWCATERGGPARLVAGTPAPRRHQAGGRDLARRVGA